MKSIICGAGVVGKSIAESLANEDLDVTVIDESKENPIDDKAYQGAMTGGLEFEEIKQLGYDNSSSHLYRIEVIDNKQFINQMRKDNIVCGIHYSALHLNNVYHNSDYIKPFRYNSDFMCLKSKKMQTRTVSLPMNEKLTKKEIEFIIDKVKELIWKKQYV